MNASNSIRLNSSITNFLDVHNYVGIQDNTYIDYCDTKQLSESDPVLDQLC